MSVQVSVVAQRIKHLREDRKLSRQALAEKLNTTYLQIYRIETGKTEVAVDDVPRFAEALTATIAELYQESPA